MLNPVIFKANDIRGVTEGAEPEWDEAGRVRPRGCVGRGVRPRRAGVAGARPRHAAVAARGCRPPSSRPCWTRGADVVDVGLASTDELWFASGRLGLPGVMFTASHNPGEYNGIKFCHPGARPIAPGELVDDRRAGHPDRSRPAGRGARDADREHDVLRRVRRPPARAGRPDRHPAAQGRRRRRQRHGRAHAAGRVPGRDRRPPIEIIGLYTDPDGNFPNHPANPLEPENLVDAQAAVREHGADLALVFDGDADRCFIIDERGEVVSPSTVTALIASQELAAHPGSTVVINKITSRSVRRGRRASTAARRS